MQEFKPGGKITLEDGKTYRVVDIINFEDKEYLFCSTNEKPILPKVLEKVKYQKKVFVKEETDPVILQKISIKILKEE